MRLAGKVAIITGGSQGIGAAIARVFAEEGAAVVVAGRSKERCEQVAEQIRATGAKALAIPTDVRDADQIEALIESTVSTFGKLDILVNNAGITKFARPIDEDSDETIPAFDDIINTNLRGAWLAIRFAVKHMKAAGGGAIIQIGSVHGVLGANSNSAYSASKGGMDALTRSLAIELAPYNIRVNSCNPGAIATKRSWVIDRLIEVGEVERANRLIQADMESRKHIQPLRMIGEPDDVGWACVYLASNEARYVTGATLMVDGGSTALLGEPARFSQESLEVIGEFQKLLQEMTNYLEGKE